ncbi:type 4a pilus biogenesis protein PilO [Pelagibaculum spongiae]|uniref:Pilus assembly protein PilP n=1 Tax=Pelagibaculum spongiae TaxID=2080658 RepID=A0A2V1GZ55_9GAMM|nr:type 4a pilus biogenesis protein PilO [Pelagibaculum spongiae]PVZ68275.1 pilus assembly protein PilP [Pelagibaculum spongiae]
MAIDLKTFGDELNNLDPHPGNWSAAVKTFFIILAVIVVLAAGYYFVVQDQGAKLQREQKQEQTLRTQFEAKQQKAANIDLYKKQMVVMQDSFGALLRQLPAETEVPGLLEDISHTGISNGLKFNVINLQAENAVEFYAELPISIEVIGEYHQLGEFVSNVAGLPRIVTLHDFSISTSKNKENKSRLAMKIQAKTYRYSVEGEG